MHIGRLLHAGRNCKATKQIAYLSKTIDNYRRILVITENRRDCHAEYMLSNIMVSGTRTSFTSSTYFALETLLPKSLSLSG
jgi:hypothetical protein